MAKQKKKRNNPKPVLKVRRFTSANEAAKFAINTADRMGIKNIGEQSAPGNGRGVAVIYGVKRPAVLTVTPRGKIPRITPKRPRLR